MHRVVGKNVVEVDLERLPRTDVHRRGAGGGSHVGVRDDIRKLDAIREAELLVVRGDEMRRIGDLLGDLIGADEQMRVVLRERAHAEQAVQRALELVRN